MRIHLIFLLFIYLITSAKVTVGQTTDFRFITKSTTASSEDNIKKSGPKYKKALKIYDRLAEARGDRRFPLPAFTMAGSERWVAYLEGDGLSIGLEEKAYDICMSYGEKEGPSAIAALLGHELTHFYEKHQWRSGFADAFSDLQIGATLNKIVGMDKVNNETQSDYLGGFLAYSAGYDVFENLPKLYDDLYKAYNLPDTMQGYATKEDRKALAVRSTEAVKKLVEVYEMANLLTATRRYDEARAFYKHILTQYQGREIYNNLGVLTILEAMSYLQEKDKRYRLPVELDLNFGGNSKGDGQSQKDSIKTALLNEAIRYLDNAISMDADYAPAYLNKACAYFLLGDNGRARFYANVEAKQRARAQKKLFPNTVANANVLIALIHEKNGDEAKAIEVLEKNKNKSALADYNLKIMKAILIPKGRKADGPEDEEIDGIERGDVYTFTRNFRRERVEQELFSQIDFRRWKGIDQLKASTIYVCRAPAGSNEPDIYFHITDPGYTGETFDGYKVGTARSDITTEYGEPGFSLETPTGQIMIYGETIFILDAEQKVKRWATYFFKS